MGAATTSLLILSVLFTSVFMIFRTQLHGDEVVGGAVRQSSQQAQQQGATAITIKGAEAFSIFRCDTIVETEIENTGEAPIEDFEKMDIFTWYTTEDNEPVTTPFHHTAGNLLSDEWAVTGVQPVNYGGLWDPGEVLAFSWRFLRPQAGNVRVRYRCDPQWRERLHLR